MTDGASPLLMTPGPTRIPERVLRAGLRVLHHRTPEFSEALAELLDRMRPLFGCATADILPVHATGRASMEGAISNLFRPGDTIVSCCNGKFGEMWAGFAERYGLHVVRICTDWERSVDPDEVAAALKAHVAPRAVTLCHSDTSTGVLNPVAEVAAVAREHGALSLVDGISSIGGAPFRFDEWDLDVAITASQKCLMSSPGISFTAVGDRAWNAIQWGALPKAYLDFAAIRDALARDRPETPGTTPVMLVLQVLEALRAIHEEGLDAVFTRHRCMADRVRKWGAANGFPLQGSGIHERSPTLTALRAPQGVSPDALRARVRERGIQIAVGLGAYKATSVRVGHMGDIRLSDVEATLAFLEEARAEVGSGP